MLLNAWGISMAIVLSLACIILTKQHAIRGGKYLLKTPVTTISETLNFKMSLDASLVPLVRVPKPSAIRYQPAT